jgi:hypothetical protein
MTNNNTNALEPIVGTTIRLEGRMFNVLDDTLSCGGCGNCALTTAGCSGMKDKYCRGVEGRMILCTARQRMDNKDIILEEVIY